MSQTFDPEFTRMRREARAITDEGWIKDFLRRAPVGALATVYEEQPFLSVKFFVYDEAAHAIYMHSANEGRVMQNIRLNPKVCFTAYEMGRFLPGKRACSFGAEYQGVVVFGRLSVVEDPRRCLEVLNLLMLKLAPQFAPGEGYALPGEDDLEGLAVYQLAISGWSAKAKLADAAFAGAYRYEEVSPR